MKILFFLFILSSCSLIERKSQPRNPSWSERKRECHSYYLDRFGFDMKDSVGICKEELERNNK